MTNDALPEQTPQSDSPDHRGHACPQIPDHELLRCIGSGSYGEVWLARSVIGTYRAVKVVYRHNFEHERPYEREFGGMEKFEPISRSHDGLVDILQVGRNDQAGYFYYVMELGDDQVAGQQIIPDRYESKTLGKEISRRGMLPFGECLQLSLSLSAALGHLHKHGLIHRDIKPSNIIFVHGIPKIADIGLVAGLGTSRSFVGTEGYIPPEGPGTAQADLYSLGKVIYEISTGKDRHTFPDLPTKLGNLTDPKEFLELNEVVLKACESDSSKRYQSAEEMQGDLLLLLAGKSVKRLRLLERRLAALTKLGVLIAVLLILIGGGVYQVNRELKRVAEDRQRQVGSFIAYGTKSMEDGDWLGSLPWFTAALRLDSNDPTKEKTHRVRIAAILQQSPKLEQMWFHTNPVTDIEFGVKGEEVLIANATDGARIWNVTNGQSMSAPFNFGGVSTLEMAKASFSPDKKFIVTSGAGREVIVWDVLDQDKPRLKVPHTGFAYGARFDPTGELLVMTEGNHAVICSAQTGQRLPPILAGHTKEVLHASFSLDGRYVVTTSQDNTALIWDAKTQKQIGKPLPHGNWVYSAAFSPDHRYVATASFDRKARVWEIETGNELFPPLRHGDGVKSVRFSPDGQFLITASLDFTVRLWNARTGEVVPPLLKHSGRVMDATFSPDGRRIITVCWDGTVRVWKFDSRGLAPEPVRTIFSPDGQKGLVAGNGKAMVQDAFTSNTLASFTSSQPWSEAVFSGDGSTLLTISQNPPGQNPAGQEAQLWHATTGQPAAPAFQLTQAESVKALSHQGDRLAICDQGVVSVRAASNGNELCRVPLNDERVDKVEFDRSGTRLVIAKGRLVWIWEIRAQPLLVAALEHPAAITHAAFSPDGELLVTSCSDKALNEYAAQVWEAKSGKPIGAPLGHRDGVLYASFSPDSQRVVTASEDFTAMIWEARTGRKLLARPLQHGHRVHHASFSQDGRWVVTADHGGVARVWDVATGDPITPPFRHPEPLRHAQFIAQDHRIVTRTDDGKTRVWELPRDTPPVEQLELMALLMSAHQGQSSGTMLPQSKIELRQCWEKLQQYHADGGAK